MNRHDEGGRKIIYFSIELEMGVVVRGHMRGEEVKLMDQRMECYRSVVSDLRSQACRCTCMGAQPSWRGKLSACSVCAGDQNQHEKISLCRSMSEQLACFSCFSHGSTVECSCTPSGTCSQISTVYLCMLMNLTLFQTKPA